MTSLPVVLALRSLETVIHQALQYDPATRQRLAALDGKSVYVELEAPRVSVMVVIQGERVRLLPEADRHPHATLEAPTAALLKLLVAKQPQLIGGGLRVQGQVQVIEQLQAMARDIQIDWEAPFAAVFGDVVGVQMGQGLRQMVAFARKTARTLVMNSAEYVRDERDLLPARWELTEFVDDNQNLRADSERLAARIQRVQQRLQRLTEPTS